MKLPDAPKRPATAYLLFCEEHRSAIVQENPSYKSADIMRAMGHAWKGLDLTEKAEFEQRAKVLQREYQTKKTSWQQECANLLPKGAEMPKPSGGKGKATAGKPSPPAPCSYEKKRARAMEENNTELANLGLLGSNLLSSAASKKKKASAKASAAQQWSLSSGVAAT